MTFWWAVCVLLASRAAAESLQEALLERRSLLDPILRGDWEEFDDSDEMVSPVCQQQMKFYREELSNFATWALTFYDASTKVPEGMLSLTTTHLGNFDECIGVRDIQTDGETIHGKYCLVTTTLSEGLLGDLTPIAAHHLERQRKNARAVTRMEASALIGVALKTAVCLPSGCSARDTEILVRGNWSKDLSNETFLTVNPLECQTMDNPPFRTIHWVAVGILSFFAVLVVLSTAYDILQKNAESRKNLLVAFSVYTNGKRLLATSSSGDTLHAVHGIRFVSICWVVMGHRYLNTMSLPLMNMMYLGEFMKDWKRLGITNATLSVDTFFVLSGLLVGYVFFKQAPKMKFFNVPLYYLHRYIRLTPALAAIILLQVSLLEFTGSGPLWNVNTVWQRENCEKSWWSHLLYVNNYVYNQQSCIGQSWYLAVDMQLHWLSPLVLVPLWKWPKAGAILLVILSLGGLVTSFVISYVNEFPLTFFGLTAAIAVDYMSYMYMPTYTRFVPYLIGIGVGYILVSAKNQGKRVKYSTLVAALLWGTAATCLLLSLCVVHGSLQPGYELNVIEGAFYNSLGRPVWGMGVALVVFLCSTGHGGFVNTLLSWPAFQPLSRLSYSIFLTHMALQTSLAYTVRSHQFLGDVNTIPQFAGDMVLSIFFAACLSLVFESPFIIIEKSLFGGGGKRAPPLPAQTTSDDAPKKDLAADVNGIDAGKLV